MNASVCQAFLRVGDYDLAATLTSGQAFRWRLDNGAWEGIIGRRWVRLTPKDDGIVADTVEPFCDWSWLTHYLQVGTDLPSILRSFPDDEPMRLSVAACRGLRLLRQDPWECLASFIVSSTKQIVQIQQIVGLLSERFGQPVAAPPGHAPVHAFPTADRLARTSDAELRACKMGFRAPYLLSAARQIAAGKLDLMALSALDFEEARAKLVHLPGVGEKIASCVLLFAYDFAESFPVDVWVMKALRELYFPRRRPRPQRLREFVRTYFGPNAGYAQQYLFHYMRTRAGSVAAARTGTATEAGRDQTSTRAATRR